MKMISKGIFHCKIGDTTYFGNRLSLSYKSSVIKMAFCLLCIAFFIACAKLPQMRTFSSSLIVVWFLFLYVLVNAINDILYTYENKQLLKLYDLNPNDAVKTIVDRKLILDLFSGEFPWNRYCAIKTPITYYKIGKEQVKNNKDTKLYYVDRIYDGEFYRYIYKDFDEFTAVLDEINRGRDIFEVMYWDDFGAPKIVPVETSSK